MQEITKENIQRIIDTLNLELADRVLNIIKSDGKKKLEIVKHTPHEEGQTEFFTIELNGRNAFPKIPLGSITSMEQAQLNFNAVKNFKTPTREVVLSEEVDHG